jgi:prepilin-type N-terminal cleavage/methylation domain-containing protein
MNKNHKFKINGFSLLELLLVIGILGLIAAFAVSISYSAKNLAKTSETKNRMREIKRAALNYYQGHKDLPAPAGTNEVPVTAAALNLEQQHRLDGWGRYFHYDRALHPVLTARTAITGITVDGKAVAGVIISGGPDQAVEATNLQSPYSTAGDDIVLPVPVNEQALALARQDLQVLQSKVQALDKIFAGVDNDSGGGVDEDGCVPVFGCPQDATNDPNCGTATLDTISIYTTCTYAVSSATAFISDFYELGAAILLDPWLQEYVWGNALTYAASDPRFHRFFSAGPDGIPGNEDDLIP